MQQYRRISNIVGDEIIAVRIKNRIMNIKMLSMY